MTIDELRELERKATAGPWSKEWLYGALRHIHKNVNTEAFFGDHCDEWAAYNADKLHAPNKGDAAFIVAMHESLIPILDRLEAAEKSLAVVHEHAIKTKAAAEKRHREVGHDGLTSQLESEASLLAILTREAAGKELAERLVALEKEVAVWRAAAEGKIGECLLDT